MDPNQAPPSPAESRKYECPASGEGVRDPKEDIYMAKLQRQENNTRIRGRRKSTHNHFSTSPILDKKITVLSRVYHHANKSTSFSLPLQNFSQSGVAMGFIELGDQPATAVSPHRLGRRAQVRHGPSAPKAPGAPPGRMWRR